MTVDWVWEQAERLTTTEVHSLPFCTVHAKHETRLTPIDPQFDPHHTTMTVFNADLYHEPGYCMGDDDVSRTICSVGHWEPVESASFVNAIRGSSDRGVVIDFGAQIGWYSRLASVYRCPVLAIEAVPEHVDLLRQNTPSTVAIAMMWVDGTVYPISATNAPRVACAKIDIEGGEVHAMWMLSELLDAGLVDNILMEVSPVFNDTYPGIIRDLMGRGFTAEVCNPHQPFAFDEIDAVVAQSPQVDMMFRKATK